MIATLALRRPVRVYTRDSKRFAVGMALPFFVAGVLTLGACATDIPGTHAYLSGIQTADPFEPVNRRIFAFNTVVHRALGSAADEADTTSPLLLAAHNFLVNLREPLVFTNDLLQGRECAAGASLRRFMVNSTLGVGGIVDVGKDLGVDAHENDFGQTLAVWGIPAGPYIMLPLVGASDLRGATGMAVEYFADPVDFGFRQAGIAEAILPTAGADAADRLLYGGSDFDHLRRNSLDEYAELRAAYRRDLEESIRDDKCPPVLRVPGDSARASAGGPEWNNTKP
jgi:phospholipid-binding lipoprotein MlaA